MSQSRVSREYRWSSIFGWTLTLSAASFCFAGAIGTFLPAANMTVPLVLSFAGMMLAAICLVNLTSAGAMHALTHRRNGKAAINWATFIPAAAACILLAIAANFGLHLGWDLLVSRAQPTVALPTDTAINFVFYTCAFAKPAIAWIIEGRKAMDSGDVFFESVAPRDSNVTSIETGRARFAASGGRITRPVSVVEIREACQALEGLGQKPSFRTVAQFLDVARSRIERTWPKGLPLRGADQTFPLLDRSLDRAA